MKIFKFFWLSFFLGIFLLPSQVQAQFTLLPATDKDYRECYNFISEYIRAGNKAPAMDQAKIDANEEAFLAKKEAQDTYDLAAQNQNEVVLLYQANDCVGYNQLDPNSDKFKKCLQIQGDEVDTKADLEEAKKQLDEAKAAEKKARDELNAASDWNTLLACGIKTGRITLAMIPRYITYITNFILGLIGLVAVLFTVIGGYYYAFGGVTEDKDKGKNTIKHAIMGLGLAILAWAIVNVIIRAVTG